MSANLTTLMIEGGIGLALFVMLVGALNLLLRRHFKQVDAIEPRLRKTFNKRFDVIDKRFDVIDKRFDVIDKRDEVTARKLDKAIEDISYLRGAFDELRRHFPRPHHAPAHGRREESSVGTSGASPGEGDSEDVGVAAESARGASSSTRS